MRWWKVTLATPTKKEKKRKKAAHFITRAAKGLARVITLHILCVCVGVIFLKLRLHTAYDSRLFDEHFTVIVDSRVGYKLQTSFIV